MTIIAVGIGWVAKFHDFCEVCKCLPKNLFVTMKPVCCIRWINKSRKNKKSSYHHVIVALEGEEMLRWKGRRCCIGRGGESNLSEEELIQEEV
jgi:hypothetical protein